MHPLRAFCTRYIEHYQLESTQAQEKAFLDFQNSEGLVRLLNEAYTDHKWVSQTLSDILAIPWIDLDELKSTDISHDILSESLLRRYPVLPLFEQSNRVHIGLANPFDVLAIEAIRFYLQRPIGIILVEKPKLDTLRQTLFQNPTLSLQSLPKKNFDEDKIASSTFDVIAKDNIDDPPLIRYVNQLLHSAIRQSASDIHFEPHKNHLRIRFRIDGILYAQPSPPLSVERLLARIKIMAQLDIAERRLPQDGRFSFVFSDTDTTIDCRVSVCPILHGEKIAIRLLKTEKSMLTLSTLGLDPQQHSMLLNTLQKTHGMVLATGPTGSGKTSTLYSALHALNQTTVNICSVEDPIEIRLPYVNQVSIQPHMGLGFEEILKVFLRQDPDIIMLGEMRDTKTAQTAIQAAQTGHLVLSTLHTNSATDTLIRLVNMGIPNYNIASSINLIIAQRLVRKLCIHCKQKVTLSRKTLFEHNILYPTDISVFKAIGCKQCTQGYKGRIGIFELLPITTSLSESILKNVSSTTLTHQAEKEGMLTLKMSAFEKLKAGIIDFSEMCTIS